MHKPNWTRLLDSPCPKLVVIIYLWSLRRKQNTPKFQILHKLRRWKPLPSLGLSQIVVSPSSLTLTAIPFRSLQKYKPPPKPIKKHSESAESFQGRPVSKKNHNIFDHHHPMAPISTKSANMLKRAKWVSVGIEFNPSWNGKQLHLYTDLGTKIPKILGLGLVGA